MEAAARLSMRARPASSPNPGVAALLVRDNCVVARGWTQSGGRPHAEADLFDQLEGSAKGAAFYVTLEPCAHESQRGPACAEVIAEARPARVIIGQQDPDPRTAGKGIARLKRAGIAVDVLDDAASAKSLAGYLTRRNLGRPYVTLKLAVSLDGCIALADGTSRWITGEAARAHVHTQRARNDAILVGGGTWRADKPRLDVRLPGLEARSPKRVLLTRGVAPDGVSVINQPEQIAALDGVQYLYVEGGGETAASFLREDLVDELHIYRAPILIGEGRPGIGDLGITDLPGAHGRWHLSQRGQLGSDEFTAYLRTRN
ncbi:bifunctional diaminohydroxyphosphoribosylaminopyrimidine deaminase/5-amino-6-(5-phosphoribosylamino)uracil reductase RibD [Erythrobacter sp. WH158]|uniref:Riboflavin biosynthesis protein RibD n=2 Tax=Erythrobacter crassostreae TaxID=2828328 RepID=A0A9X1F329_9SPHN|nr:bifunctional diaminohydroxyphosphoribosylaminopyrimidine deaminase/5-amino-6-(5-phosphoribosylamino)uracil reductase RibD [Erythrobacter crassostrea]MBV7259086.1 bifunctional diaminohydroxyphosphoribosylaminopyrimidine deaminase/5-amino-6-(5-phosphoribosylamino)uracil reductase RibD [Erythrobacter crassostrea]